MANIALKDLETSNIDNLNRNLSEDELTLHGGCGKKFTIRLPNGLVITGMDLCNPILPNTPFPF
jgi:hypothetical protein